jgi:hypothetical protein
MVHEHASSNGNCSPENSNCPRFTNQITAMNLLVSALHVSYCRYPHRSLMIHTSGNFELTLATIFHHNRKYKPKG